MAAKKAMDIGFWARTSCCKVALFFPCFESALASCMRKRTEFNRPSHTTGSVEVSLNEIKRSAKLAVVSRCAAAKSRAASLKLEISTAMGSASAFWCSLPPRRFWSSCIACQKQGKYTTAEGVEGDESAFNLVGSKIKVLSTCSICTNTGTWTVSSTLSNCKALRCRQRCAPDSAIKLLTMEMATSKHSACGCSWIALCVCVADCGVHVLNNHWRYT